MTDEELLRRIREYAMATSQAADYRTTGGQVDSAHAADGLATTYYYEIRDELLRRRAA